METIKKALTMVFSGTLLLLASCVAEDGPYITEIDTIEVSFSADIQPIFDNKCITCHTDAHSTGLDLQSGASYNLLVDIPAAFYGPNLRVEPFSTDNSVLWHKIIDDGVYGGGMPPGEALSNFEIEKIRVWIEEGALNN